MGLTRLRALSVHQPRGPGSCTGRSMGPSAVQGRARAPLGLGAWDVQAGTGGTEEPPSLRLGPPGPDGHRGGSEAPEAGLLLQLVELSHPVMGETAGPWGAVLYGFNKRCRYCSPPPVYEFPKCFSHASAGESHFHGQQTDTSYSPKVP